MNLSPRQQRALHSICETFAPAAGGWPSAVEMGIPAAIAEALDYNPRTSDRADLLQLLDLWDSRLHALFTVGRLQNFSSLPLATRTRILLSWADSNLVKRRAAFQALRKAVGFLYVMLPGANAARSGVWDKFGYPGPLGLQKPSGPRTLAVVAGAGKDVLVLEAGGYFDDADFDGAELGGFRNLYAEAGFAATADHSVGLL